MPNKKLISSILIIINCLFLVCAVEAQSVPQGTLTADHPCRVEVDDVHFSKFSKNQGKEEIKAKANSTCIYIQDKIYLTVEIWKKGLFGSHKVASEPTENKTGPVPAGVPFFNKITVAKCKNHLKTTYFAIAFGKALINGKNVHTSKVRSPHDRTEFCGT